MTAVVFCMGKVVPPLEFKCGSSVKPKKHNNRDKSDSNLRQVYGKRVFDFTADKASKLINGKKKLSPEQVIKILNIPEGTREELPHYRALLAYTWVPEKKVVRHAEFSVETELDIQVIMSVYGNKEESAMHLPKGDINVYIGHTSSYDDILNIPQITELANQEKTLVAMDPRGIGQSLPKTCATNDFFHQYGADYMYAAYGEMMNRSYLGQRVFDVLRCLDLLYAEGAQHITLYGRGINSVTVAFATFLHEKQPSAILIDYLPSYKSLIENPLSKWPLSAMPKGIPGLVLDRKYKYKTFQCHTFHFIYAEFITV